MDVFLAGRLLLRHWVNSVPDLGMDSIILQDQNLILPLVGRNDQQIVKIKVVKYCLIIKHPTTVYMRNTCIQLKHENA